MPQPRIPLFWFYRNRALFTLLFLAAILFLPGGSAFGATPVQENELMQFTAGGHVLGFEPDRVYVAAGDHMFSVAFAGTQGVKPVADTPAGPYRRLAGGRAVQDSGHEVLVWPWNGGVMSLVSSTGPEALTLQLAEDGVDFRVVGRLPRRHPLAPGVFRSDLSVPPGSESGVAWGVCMATYRGDPYLVRYECIWNAP